MGREQVQKIKQYRPYMLLVPFALVLVLQFNNCSKYQPPEITSSSTSENESNSGSSGLTKTGDLCEDTLRELFAKGYYKMVRTNCAQCHATDSSRPQFASPDINWAFTVFQSRGYGKISANAVSPTHNPPVTGVHLTQQVNELKVEWQQGVGEYNTCKGLPPETVPVDPRDLLTVQTSDKPIPALNVDQEVILTWDLRRDLQLLKPNMSLPNLGAKASFSIKVARRKNAAGQDYYTFRDPVIFENATDIKVKTMYIKLNTRLVSYPSTFKFIDKSLYAGSTAMGTNMGLLSTGGLVALGATSSRDFINVAFETLESTVLGARPAPAAVSFSNNGVQFVTATQPSNREISFEVSSNVALEAPIVISVESVEDNLCGKTGDETFTADTGSCLPNVHSALASRGLADANNVKFKKARSVAGTGSYNRFDWDYKIVSSSFNLTATNTKGLVKVKFSNDIRFETNRLLRLRINVMSANAGVAGGDLFVVIQKVNNPQPVGEVTFSSLMRPATGVLGLNCVKCHNSRDLNGGYDMTDFELMLAKRVLIQDPMNPDRAENSKMFYRMNPNYTGVGAGTPMPIDGYIADDEKIDLVRKWIRSGAKNN